MKAENPYASALDGLVLDDPVAAFFAFCREREAVRCRRAAGEPAPWSEDEIFQKARFLNVFREDDRGSQALLRFAEPVAEQLERLVHGLFFARWCNRQSTLDALSADLLESPEALISALESLPEPPWCNWTAYPVEPVRWQGQRYSRWDSATDLFRRIRPELTKTICAAGGDVIKATEAVNGLLHMDNDFPIFMAVMDLAWFRPDIIDPASPVPTGIGAAPFLDRLEAALGAKDHQETAQRMIELQASHWPEAKRAFQPIDIEYLACECRKYYSYVNGSKAFEGKNRFLANQSPRILFDLPSQQAGNEPLLTQIHVIAGGPCSGKTTLLKALAEAGYRVEVETAERMIQEGLAQGQTAQELRAEPMAWQQEVLRQDHALFQSLPADRLLLTDTSLIETVVFAERAGMELGPQLQDWLQHQRYRRVFFLEPLPAYEESAVRMESRALAERISQQVRAAYEAHGYELTSVPAMPLAERVKFVRSLLDSAQP